MVSPTTLTTNTTTTNLRALFCIQKKEQRTRIFFRKITFPKSKAPPSALKRKNKRPLCIQVLQSILFPSYNHLPKSKGPVLHSQRKSKPPALHSISACKKQTNYQHNVCKTNLIRSKEPVARTKAPALHSSAKFHTIQQTFARTL